MVGDQVHDGVQTPVHRASVVTHTAEIGASRLLLILGHMHRVAHQLVHAFILGGGDGHHRDTQHGLHLVDADGAAVAPHLIHHVQCQHHGHIQLQKLHGQIEIPLDIGGVHDVDDAGGLFVDDELPGNDLLAGIGGHGIDARQVGDLGVGVFPDGAALAVHRHAGEVAHMLVGAGQLIEQRGLSAVLVARQGEGQRGLLRQGVFPRFDVEPSPLAQAGMLTVRADLRRRSGRLSDGPDRRDVDLCGVRQPQRQLIAVDPQLHGVAHGREFHQCHLCAGDQAHVQKMLAQGALSAHHRDPGGLASLQLRQRMYVLLYSHA